MKTYALILLAFLPLAGGAQYFYNDILGTQDIENRMQAMLEGRVASVKATGYDDRGAPSRDFNEWHQIDAGRQTWFTQIRNAQNITRMAYRFNDKGQLMSLADTTGGISSKTQYSYDEKGRLTEISISIQDTAQEFSQQETHSWIYEDGDTPVKMFKILNEQDSTEYRFKSDEKGNVIEEQLFRRNTGFETVYYYYNQENQLTDIVRYNNRVRRLLPDFMFEYDEEGRVAQKISTLSTRSSDYLIWRYAYNEKDLKIREALFNKQKELTGRIDYLYSYLP
jgi:YD repeat-containing protein